MSALGSNQTFDAADANGRCGPLANLGRQGGKQTFAALSANDRIADKAAIRPERLARQDRAISKRSNALGGHTSSNL
ncbi:hypothetical protein FIU92_00560 [Ruegeria sp. THAF33]|nr:hypothetical protein FIU92_00560 [Ruegeria sp. THAF33]